MKIAIILLVGLMAGCRELPPQYGGKGENIRFIRDRYLSIISPNGELRATLVQKSSGRVILIEPLADFRIEPYVAGGENDADFKWTESSDAYWNNLNELVVLEYGEQRALFYLDRENGILKFRSEPHKPTVAR